MEGLILTWTGLLGACVGSFTNVVAWRLPRQESVVFPVSHCPKCGHAISVSYTHLRAHET